MRLSEEYAAVLRSIAHEEKAAEKFLTALKSRGHLKLLPSILSSYDRLVAKESKTAVDTLVVAREKDATAAKEAAKSFGATHPKVEVDHSVIGGWRFVGKSTLVDATYKRALLDLYRKMTA